MLIPGRQNYNNEVLKARCWPFFPRRIFPAATILTCSVDQPPCPPRGNPKVLTTYTTSSGQMINTKRMHSSFLSDYRPSPNFVHKCHAVVPKFHHLALHVRRGADNPRPKGSVCKAGTCPGKGSHMLPTCPIPMAHSCGSEGPSRKSAASGRSRWYRDAHHEALHGYARRRL